jgi:flagellar motor protein MotB
MKSSYRRWIFVLFASLLLIGCVPKRAPYNCCCCYTRCPPASHCPKPPVEVVNTCSCCDIVKELQKYDIQVIVIGDTLRLVLQTDTYIRPSTNQVDPRYEAIFTLIAQLIRCFPVICPCDPIYVVGHTDNVGSTEGKIRRSCVQAHSVASYLWSNGIPLARMKILGYGDFDPVSGNKTMIGSASNRRIEILVNYPCWRSKP